MHTISNSVVKKDHAPKMEGRSVYVCDIDKHGVLCGKMLRSKYARAKLLSVKVPELPDGYYYVDRNDVPGDNNVNIVMDDTPVYARETVEYIKEIRDSHHLTVFLIEHHMDLVMKISDYIYVIDFGSEIARGVPKEVQQNKRVIEAYLGVTEDA